MKKLTFANTCLLNLILALLCNHLAEAQTQNQQSPCSTAVATYYPTPNYPVPIAYTNQQIQSAGELNAVLFYHRARGCGDPAFTIEFAPNVLIDFSQVDPRAFPLFIGKNITLQGDFFMGSVNHGTSTGTRIFFPWLYELGWANDVDLSHAELDCGDSYGAAFRMLDNTAIRNICLYGPRTDTKDWNWGVTSDQFVDYCVNPYYYWPVREGINMGIMVSGNKCDISYCEFYGFGHAGVEVTDIVHTQNYGYVRGGLYGTCFDEPNDLKGVFDFHHNYVHNCKAYGFGYGIWVSAGSGGDTLQINVPGCSPIKPKFYNFIRPDEEANIHDNIFFENKHDIASSGNRLSLNIRQNTFSQRSADYNVNMHNGDMWVCNPMNDIYNSSNVLTPMPVFTGVGGSLIQIEDNIFYRGSAIDLQYPNINDVSGSSHSLGYNFNPAKIEINGNYFFVPGVTLNANHPTLHWPSSIPGNPWDGYNYVRIADQFFHYQYLFNGSTGDPHIQVDEGTGNAINPFNECGTTPFDITSETPVAVITSNTDANHSQGAVSTTANKLIIQGESLWFDTHKCEDKDRNSPPMPGREILNIWRMHTQKSDLTDEIRTDNANVTNPFKFKFDLVGINNITLMTVDLTGSLSNSYRASDLKHQKVTVRPAKGRYLTFWIKDTYVGRQLQPWPGSSRTNGVDNGALPPPVAPTLTNFQKFVKVNGVKLWYDDIVGDSGWQYVKVPLEGQQYDIGDIEIGIETVGAVDAERVKGVTVYIDDVYINCPYGDNAIYNGDMELVEYTTDPHNPTKLHALGWNDLYNEQQNPALVPPITGIMCGDIPTDPTYPLVPSQPYTGNTLGTDEVRSGTWSYTLYVKEIERRHFISYPTYKAPYVFKSIKQHYSIYEIECTQHDQMINDNFDIYPSPAPAGSRVALLYDEEVQQKKHVEVLTLQGTMVHSDYFNGGHYDFVNKLSPGIYVVRISTAKGSTEKKLVITH